MEGAEFTEWRGMTTFVIRWLLKILLWASFVTWLAVFFLYPLSPLEPFFANLFKVFGGTAYKLLGAVFLVFDAPLLITTILAIIYVIAFPREENHRKKKQEIPRIRLCTFPTLIGGPFGIVSAAELIGILVFVLYLLSSFSMYTIDNHSYVAKKQLSSSKRSYLMLEETGLRFASMGFTVLSLLFLPITRGSVLLRLIDIPVEQTTRYHIWMGHAMMTLFTLHGLCYIVSWTLKGRLLQEIVKWDCDDFSYLAGLLTLICGLLIWITSMHRIRRNHFEIFYYTHQLYFFFIIFLVMHVGDSIFSCGTWGVVLFMIDRYLRFWQSRQTVDIISAKSVSSGTVELAISKPSTLKYSTLSFVFLKVRELSLLQWHPFSVSSSPLDGDCHLTVLCKPLGDWTKNLKDCASSEENCGKITAAVEGPYGHESEYYLRYDNLILIAGGIGISPFLAILRHIQHLVKADKPSKPKNISLVWSVKTSNDLSLLSLLDLRSTSSLSRSLNLDVQCYITQESETTVENGHYRNRNEISCSYFPRSKRVMSPLTGQGNRIWAGLYLASSMIGIFVFTGLLQAFYVTPYHVTCWWIKGLLLFSCIIAGVAIFGGIVIFFWNMWEKRALIKYETEVNLTKIKPNREETQPHQELPDQSSNIQSNYGRRPDFQLILESLAKRWGHVNVGVIVCGPQSLQTAVARECRSQNIENMRNRKTIFHFHSHSFEF